MDDDDDLNRKILSDYSDNEIIDYEYNITKKYISYMLDEIEKFNSDNNFSLALDFNEFNKSISTSKTDMNNAIAVISILRKAGSKSSQIFQRKIDAIKDLLGFKFSQEEIETFSNQTSQFISEWLSRLDIDQKYLAQEVSIDTTHLNYRSLVIGITAIYTNVVNNNKSAGVKLAINHASAFTGDELIGTLCGTRPFKSNSTENSAQLLASDQKQGTKSYPTSWNLVDQGIIGPVLNQGSCGCCYSFSATEALEGLYASLNNKTQYFLSQQQIVDCDTTNSGCNGGTYQAAWMYAQSANGLTTSSVYPYTSGNGKPGVCESNLASESVLTLQQSFAYKAIQTDSQMQAAAYTQPVSIAIQASSSCFQNYKSGVLTPQNCNCGTNIDHAVLLVGWGVTSDGTEYWIVKNSWGSSWGNQGYVWIARLPQSTNYCGMYQQSAIPTTAVLTEQCASSTPPTYCQIPSQQGSSNKIVTSLMLLFISFVATIFTI